MKQLLFACLSICFLSVSYAQTATQCSRSLDEAEQAFEQGRLLFILNKEENRLFYQCLEGGSFTIEEEIRAKKLLVKAYLFTDNEDQAEESLVDLLIVDKEHQLTPEDPAELHFLYSKFKTEPIIRVSGRLGLNKTYITQLQAFNTFQAGDKRYNEEGQNTGLGIGFWAELLAEKHLGKGVEVAAGPQLRRANYEVEGDLIEGNLTYLATNQSTTIRLPVLVRYNFGYNAKDNEGNRKRLIPYVFLGASFDYTLDAQYVETSRTGGTAFTLTDANASLTEFDQVATQNASLFGGLGAKLRVGRAKVDFLTFEFRYDNSFFNYINPDNRWDNQDVRFGIGHVEDDLTINTASVSIGYTRSFYIPRKRKQYR